MCRAVPPLPHMSSWFTDKLTICLEQGHMISETVVWLILWHSIYLYICRNNIKAIQSVLHYRCVTGKIYVYTLVLHHCWGCAMAKVPAHHLADSQVCSQARPYGFCGGHVALGQVSVWILGFSPLSVMPPILRTHFLSLMCWLFCTRYAKLQDGIIWVILSKKWCVNRYLIVSYYTAISILVCVHRCDQKFYSLRVFPTE